MGIFQYLKEKRETRRLAKEDEMRKNCIDIINDNGINEIFREVYKLGKLIRKKYYKKNGVLHGKYLEYNNDGTEIWIEREINYKDGLKDGSCRYYWKKNISAEGNFSDGEETGIIKKYFRYEDELKDVKLHPIVKEIANLEKGIFKIFNLEGEIIEESEIEGVKFNEGSNSTVDGCYGGIYPVRNGLCTKWFDSGNIKEKGYWGKNNTSSIYNLSHRKGKHTQFHENGNTLKEGDWMDKVPVGIHKFFYPNGNIEFEIEYETPSINIYDGSFPEKERTIKEIWYNENGSLMNSSEIIEKGGIDPRKKPNLDGVHVSWSHNILNQESFVLINNIKFKRMGEVQFYYSYYSTDYSLGHSYSVLS